MLASESTVSATLQVGRVHGAGVRPVGQLIPWCSQWREKAQLEWKFQGTPAVAKVPSVSPSSGATDFSILKDSIKMEGRRECGLSLIPSYTTSKRLP